MTQRRLRCDSLWCNPESFVSFADLVIFFAPTLVPMPWCSFQIGGSRYAAGTPKRMNVEHRTSNVERPILMALRFSCIKKSESQNIECRKEQSPVQRRCLCGVLLYHLTTINRPKSLFRHSSFVVRPSTGSMFDVLQFLYGHVRGLSGSAASQHTTTLPKLTGILHARH